MGKPLRILAALMLSLALTACSSAPQQTSVSAAPTLPPDAQPYGAPIGDAGLSYDAVADLYLPDPTGTRLVAQQQDVTLTLGRSPAETVIRALLAYEDSASARSLGQGVSLQLGGVNPVEYSCGVCTVSLASSALQLERDDFYTLCLAIASTLGAQGFTAVNVLVAGQCVGMDITSTLPLGTLSAHPGDDLATLWTQLEARRPALGADASRVSLNANATLYFPTAQGTGILAETRALSFPGQTPLQLATVLLDALSAGARELTCAAHLPSLADLMTSAPQISDRSDGSRVISLFFPSDLDALLRTASVDPAAFVASLAYTLTTFIPSVTGVMIYAGDVPLQNVRNVDYLTYPLTDGIATRQDFSTFVMDAAQLTLVSGSNLTLSSRPMPYLSSATPRALLLALMSSVTANESAAGLSTLLPVGLGDADILGLSVVDDTLLVNFTTAFVAACPVLSPRDEQLMAYQMVDTLCRTLKVRRIRFFFGSAPLNTLSGSLWWNGEFFEDATLFRQN